MGLSVPGLLVIQLSKCIYIPGVNMALDVEKNHGYRRKDRKDRFDNLAACITSPIMPLG